MRNKFFTVWLAIKLPKRNITLLTRAKKMMDSYDRLVLRKHTVIEFVNNLLKNICDIEHL
ncbi:MAG: transposase [Oscillospiraceae bacterium]|nr:transposase [Oscillospiraceae bacterium]